MDVVFGSEVVADTGEIENRLLEFADDTPRGIGVNLIFDIL
jgi:hypothetical protein